MNSIVLVSHLKGLALTMTAFKLKVMTYTLVKTRKAKTPLADLAEVPEAEPQSRWHLVVPLIDGPDEKWTGVAFPDYGGGLISERLTMQFYDRQNRTAGILVDLEGETTGGTLKLTIFMIDTPFRHGEVVCTGERVNRDFIATHIMISEIYLYLFLYIYIVKSKHTTGNCMTNQAKI